MSTTLDDLRRANLAEQRQDGDRQAAQTLQTPQIASEDIEPTITPANTDVRDSVSTGTRTDGIPQVRKDSRKPARQQGRTQGSEAVREAVRAAAAEPLHNDVDAAGADFLERVRTAVNTKKTHAGGVKTTVEMTPDLNLRAKRYALDHGNVPVRQIFLELMTAFLDEEGY